MSEPRLYVIGLDGVPFTVLRDFLDQGIMPRLRELAGRSVFRSIRSVQPPLSAPAWASFLTGRPPDEHGVMSFTERDPRAMRWFTPDARQLTAPTLQEMASDMGRRVFSMNFPVTYPPKPVNGVSICGFLGKDLESGVYPEREVPLLKQRGYRIDSDVALARHDLPAFINDLKTVLTRRLETAMYYHDREPWDLFMVHIMETDRLHHFTYEAFQKGDEAIRDVYHQLYGMIDPFIGALTDQAPPGSRFLLLSDHGFTVLKREIYLNHWLWEQGFLRFNHPRPAHLGHIHPASVAYSLYPGRLYIHLKGREASGSVPPDKYEQTRETLRRALTGLRDPVDGAPVVAEVLNGEDVYAPPGLRAWHDPLTAAYPDLLVIAREGYDLKGMLWKGKPADKTVYNGMHSYDNAFWIAPQTEKAAAVNDIREAGVFTAHLLTEMF